MNPYLFFNGQCEAAFAFYAEALGGRVVAMMRQGEAPPEAQNPPEGCAMAPEKIMHACLEIGGQMLMGSDAPAAYWQPPQGFAVHLACPTPAAAEQAYARLAEGGTPTMPMAETFWALRFGMLVDRFGTPWMVNCLRQDCAAAA
jgi:PhnB protein